MSGFSIDWLDLREDADRRARNSGLLEGAQQWLDTRSSADKMPVVVDLGAGTGSTLRAMAVRDNPVPVFWRLLDHDTTLLAEAQRRHGDEYAVETVAADLARVATLPLEDADLLTASALFDLVSTDFIKELINSLRSNHSAGVYAALNYDGTTHWAPAHPLDGSVLDAFNRDQRRDKGFGPALGPDAGTHIEALFIQAGFMVTSASSPWQLNGTDQVMVSALIDGIVAAVAQDPQFDAQALEEWRDFRHSNVATGTCTVGHVDILALPAPPPGS